MKYVLKYQTCTTSLTITRDFFNDDQSDTVTFLLQMTNHFSFLIRAHI